MTEIGFDKWTRIVDLDNAGLHILLGLNEEYSYSEIMLFTKQVKLFLEHVWKKRN